VCADTVVVPACFDLQPRIGFVDLQVEVGRHQLAAGLRRVEASISTFDRIGIVLRRSTTDWTWLEASQQHCAFDRRFHSSPPSCVFLGKSP
jgi:hypothetical protein